MPHMHTPFLKIMCHAQFQCFKSYVNIINATRAALRTAVPKSQVSTCVAWSPDDIDGRGYNARGLSEASDLLYIMV